QHRGWQTLQEIQPRGVRKWRKRGRVARVCLSTLVSDDEHVRIAWPDICRVLRQSRCNHLLIKRVLEDSFGPFLRCSFGVPTRRLREDERQSRVRYRPKEQAHLLGNFCDVQSIFTSGCSSVSSCELVRSLLHKHRASCY